MRSRPGHSSRLSGGRGAYRGGDGKSRVGSEGVRGEGEGGSLRGKFTESILLILCILVALYL